MDTKTAIRTRWKGLVAAGPRSALAHDDHAFVTTYAQKHPKLDDLLSRGGCITKIFVGQGPPPYEWQDSMHVVVTVEQEHLSVDHTLSVEPILKHLDKPKADAVAGYQLDVHTEQARVLVEDQKRAHRQARTSVAGLIRCADCKQDFGPREIDMDHHTVLFNQLLETFRAIEQGSLTDFFDAAIADKWRTYHDAHATWQPLCRPCHYKKSGFETSVRAAAKRHAKNPATGDTTPSSKRPKRPKAPKWTAQEHAALKACHDAHGHQCKANLVHFLAALPGRDAHQIYGAGANCACKRRDGQQSRRA